MMVRAHRKNVNQKWWIEVVGIGLEILNNEHREDLRKH